MNGDAGPSQRNNRVRPIRNGAAGPSQQNRTNPNNAVDEPPKLKADEPLVCDDIEETVLLQNLDYGANFVRSVESPFGLDSVTNSRDGRFMFVHRVDSIIALDTTEAKTWRFTHPDVRLINEFMSTDSDHGILLYSPIPITELIFRREMYLAKIQLDFNSSAIRILESAPFNSDVFIKSMSASIDESQFVLLSEKRAFPERPTSTFYIYNVSNIEQPVKSLEITRLNDKILFPRLIGSDLYFLDVPQICLFEDMFLKRSRFRRLSIESGEVEVVETSEFPPCRNYIAYGNRSWHISGKWASRSLYISLTMPYSDPENHLFFELNADSRQWREILINGLPSVRHTIIRPGREVDQMYYMRDDRAALLISVPNNRTMKILQPRNWDHTEIAGFRVTMGAPQKLTCLARDAVLNKWPMLTKKSREELIRLNLPPNLF